MEMKYNDKFDADQQVDLEERIAALIFDEGEGPFGELAVNEESANEQNKKILQMVVAELRPDLVAHKWRISDGNATEIYEDWDDVCYAAEQWYYYLPEEIFPCGRMKDEDIPSVDFSEIPESHVETLNEAIRAWEEKIAHAAGFKDFYGHGNYAVSAASEMGLNLTVEEVEE